MVSLSLVCLDENRTADSHTLDAVGSVTMVRDIRMVKLEGDQATGSTNLQSFKSCLLFTSACNSCPVI